MSPHPEYTPDQINLLPENSYFVFGANEAGHHQGGAAAHAQKLFGAVWGQGEGLQGDSYGIPTMGDFVDMADAIHRFLTFAQLAPEMTFYVTQIGCGIAGHQPKHVAPLFKGAPGNVIMPRVFAEIIEGDNQ